MSLIKTHISAELANQLFLLEKETFVREFDLPARSTEEVNEFLQNSEIFLEQRQDAVVGFIAFDQEQVSTEIKLVVVQPSAQKTGIGTSLLHAVLAENVGSLIYLTVHPRNSVAISFYLKAGFSIACWIDNCYGDGQPRLRLEKQL
jgi:ribosomal protein S18 acetylase RimI-like enzyme